MGKAIFKLIDANHDGKITLQELKDARAKVEARMKAFRAEHAKGMAGGPRGRPLVLGDHGRAKVR